MILDDCATVQTSKPLYKCYLESMKAARILQCSEVIYSYISVSLEICSPWIPADPSSRGVENINYLLTVWQERAASRVCLAFLVAQGRPEGEEGRWERQMTSCRGPLSNPWVPSKEHVIKYSLDGALNDLNVSIYVFIYFITFIYHPIAEALWVAYNSLKR